LEVAMNNEEMTEPRLLLGVRWFRAELMKQQAEDILKRADFDYDRVIENGEHLELDTYLSFWLGALYVAVEGLIDLECGGVKVPGEQIDKLRRFRNEAFHFVCKGNKVYDEMLEDLEWAESVHLAFKNLVIADIRGEVGKYGYELVPIDEASESSA
jgi:hypothetical protein